MEQELYYLIAKFLAAGPCKESAQVLERELDQQRQLLPHTMTYDGSQVPLTMEHLKKKYPDTNGNYLLSLLEHFLHHYKTTGDPQTLRGNALRHGDESLLTMLSAFVPEKQYDKSNYLTMSRKELANLSVHQILIAREMGVDIMQKSCTQTFLSTFYKERVTINGHRFPVFCLAFDKTNRRLFTGSDDYLVKVWCVRTGHLIYTIRGHYNVITDIAINEENTLIATASSDGYIRVWTMDGYKQVVCLRPISTIAKPFTTVCFSPSPRPETRYLMATNEDGLVRLWKWNRDTLQFMDPESPITFACKFRARDKLRCSSFNNTGTKFTVAGDDGFVYVFSTIKNGPSDHGRLTRNTNKLSLSDGQGRRRRRVPSALFPDKNTQDQPQPVEPIAILEGHMGSVTDLAFSHDGRRILSGSQDGTARIWSFNKVESNWTSIVLDIKKTADDAPVVKPMSPSETTKQATKRYYDASTQPEDNAEFGTLIPPLEGLQHYEQSTLATNDNINSTMSSDTPSATPADITVNANAQHQESEEAPKVSMIAWTADDRLCVIATTYGDIKVYYAHNGEPACILKGHIGETYAVDSHPQDSNTILSAGYDGNVILWDIRRQSVITWRNHPNRIFLDCKFSKDGMKYAITDDEGNCTLFGINGLAKDYAQTKAWTRGQYFYNDYLPVRYSSDGTFVDEQTNLPTDRLPPSSIIDMQGIEYPHQQRRGYGRDIAIQSPTFETEDAQRLVCYEMDEQNLKAELTYTLPVMDRAQIAKRRRDFVKNDDDDENEVVGGPGATFPLFPIPANQAYLLPDDSNDEDYREEDQPAEQVDFISDEDSDANGDGGSDDFINTTVASLEQFVESDGEDGPPVTRSRTGRRQRYSNSSDNSGDDILPSTSGRTSSRRSSGRRRQASPSMATSSGISSRRSNSSNRTARNTRKRRPGIQIRSDDDDDDVLRPRRRAQQVKSYNEAESDLEDFEESEDNMINVMDIDEQQPDTTTTRAGPSSSTASRRETTNKRSKAIDKSEDDDFMNPPKRPLTKRRRQIASDDSDDDMVIPTVTKTFPTSSASAASGFPRLTRSQQLPQSPQQQEQQQTSSSTPRSSIKNKGKKRATISKPITRKPLHHRTNVMRNLTEDEIKLYAPTNWIRMTQRSMEKYLPQMGDRVVLLVEGHRQYWENSEMTEYFDAKFSPLEYNLNEPVVFATVTGISWQVGPPAFCRLKLQVQELANFESVMTQRHNPRWVSPSSPATSSRGGGGRSSNTDITLEYSDEDGCPEFLVLWERFWASMSIFFGPTTRNQRVDAMYDVGKYTGRISAINETGMFWHKARKPSPWTCYHIIWDDESSSPEDLSPWEVVPTGENFSDWYDIGPSLSDDQIHRAKDVLNWLINNEDFLLYVHQVDYHTYTNYLSKIAYPICLEMVKDRLNSGYYRQLEALIDDVELIRKNAQNYNHQTSLAYKNAGRMANFFRSRMTNLHLALSIGRARKSQEDEDGEYSNTNPHEDSDDSEPTTKALMLSDDSDGSDAFIDDDDADD
ncbi:hypothetical protein BC941DRAFT_421884 [Chlamydoabsidia padenii]|nr:hypothetical protein BC941DRAFT_421884 [Chlamydoabsidia padenii]